MTGFCDVLIVGGGGAGTAAAIEAADAGASVVVLEAGAKPGGATALSAGVFYAAGTRTQAEAGVSDDPERMYRHYMTLNQWNLEPWLIRRFAEDGAPTLEWLKGFGVEYPPSLLYMSGVDDVPRGHQTPGGGLALFERLYGVASARGVAFHCGVRAEHLVVEDGCVVGVRAQGAEMRAGAVVLAAGGVGSDREQLVEFYPPAAKHEPRWSYYFGSPTVRGDALRLARAIGAAVAGRNRALFVHGLGLSRDVSNYLPTWIVLVNEEGVRFMDETIPYAVSGNLVEAQPNSRAIAVLDESARAAADNRHAFFEKMGMGDYAFSGERIQQEVERGFFRKAATLPELAAQFGVNPNALVNTVAAYNADVEAGADRRFEKKGPLRAVADPPFYGVEIRSASYATTSPGVRIDPQTQVYDTDEQVIRGLYAAGEAAGGITGDRYIGGGNSIAMAMIFGRIAGRNAARFAQENPDA